MTPLRPHDVPTTTPPPRSSLIPSSICFRRFSKLPKTRQPTPQTCAPQQLFGLCHVRHMQGPHLFGKGFGWMEEKFTLIRMFPSISFCSRLPFCFIFISYRSPNITTWACPYTHTCACMLSLAFSQPLSNCRSILVPYIKTPRLALARGVIRAILVPVFLFSRSHACCLISHSPHTRSRIHQQSCD